MSVGKVEVPPSEIRSALASSWNDAATDDVQDAKAHGEKDQSMRIRATLSNIIMLLPPSPDKKINSRIDALIESLCIVHPSRFFIIEMLDSSADGGDLRTAVSSRCVLASSGSHVCSEEIYISVKPAAAQHIPNLLLSNLVPDVAADLLLLGNPLAGDCPVEEQGVLQLVAASDRMSDRVIFDSSRFESFGECLQSIIAQSSDDAGQSSFGVSGIYSEQNYKFRDVNWRRLRRWRSLVREQFNLDRISGRTDSLATIEIVTADKNAQPRMGADAVLLGAWIGSSLNSTFQTFTKDDSQLNVDLFGTDTVRKMSFKGEPNASLEDGTLLELRFEFGSADDRLVLSLRRSVDQQNIVVSVEEDSASEFVRRVSYVESSFEELVLDDVVSNDRGLEFSQVFEAAINLTNNFKGQSY